MRIDVRGIGPVLLLCGSSLLAQTATQGIQMPDTPAQGPASPRMPAPSTPPRDGSPAAMPVGTSRIRGRVIAAETGAPLRRAQVRLTGTAGTTGPLMETATTDADGRYEFAKLPASRYTLMVSRNGYVSLQFGQVRPFEPGKPLTLADGEQADKIDFALPRGGVIAGRISDDSGEPMAGIRVQAQRYQYMPGGQRRLVASGTSNPFGGVVTDDLGQFRLYGLMPGSYVVSAMAQTNGTLIMTTGTSTSFRRAEGQDDNDGFANTYFPGTADVQDAQAISVQLGQESLANFALVSTRMVRVSGIIRNSQGGRGSGRVMVSLRTAFGNGGFNTTGMSTVGPDGSFVISNVPAGDHFIDVRPMNGPLMTSGTPGAEEEFASVAITVAGQDINDLVITTGLGATVSGRLVFDGNSARPQTPQPLRVFATAADPSVQTMTFSSPDNGVVDEAGRFQIRSVSGEVIFRVGAQGWNLKSVTLNGVDITDTPFEARPSSSVEGLEITLTDRQTGLSGTVRNSIGEPVKDFVVTIFPESVRDGILPARFTRTVRPDQDGRYQVRGLPPGDYVAAAVETLEQGGEWDPAFQQQVRPRGKTFRLTDGQLTTLDLTLVP